MSSNFRSILAVIALITTPLALAACGGTGATGATGATGPTGAAGANGTNGTNGATGATGPAGTNGTNGATGPTGPAGSGGTGDGGNAVATGSVNITVLAANQIDGGVGTPLQGVTVTAETTAGSAITAEANWVLTATTSAAGTASLTLPLGAYDITFALSGYTAPGTVTVGVVPLQQVAISVSMNEAGSSKPSVALAWTTDIGYGNSETVTATATSPIGSALTYTWTNTTTAPVLGTVTGNGATATVTTPTMAEAMARYVDPAGTAANLGAFVAGYNIPNTFGKFPISYDTQGSVAPMVTVTDANGYSVSATASGEAGGVVGGLSAASQQNDTLAAAVGTLVYLNSGYPAMDGGVTWSFTPPTGSSAALSSVSSAYPSFIPDMPGKYVATLGANSLTVYVGTWVGVIDNTGTSPSAVTGAVPYTINAECTACHTLGGGGLAIDEFTPWMTTGHSVKLTSFLSPGAGTLGSGASFVDPESSPYSGQGCLECHSVGYDLGNKYPNLAWGMSQAELDAGFVVGTAKTTPWASVPQSVAQMANIQCESCHGPQGNGQPGGFNPGHELTDVGAGNHEPFQSPRISYAAETCAQCHAAGTTHHDYSEWATTNPDDGLGHSVIAEAHAVYTAIDAGVYELASSCAGCHSAQGYTEYVANLGAGDVSGVLQPSQLAPGQISPNTIQPITCAACHDPHQDAVSPTGEDEHQLRVYDSVAMLPGGFGVSDMGAGAICTTCHNSHSGGYGENAVTSATTTAYLHEDSDPVGSNPANPALTAAGTGSTFKSFGTPDMGNQADVFEGHNAFFLDNQTPMISAHSAVTDTCVGCHMINNPNTYSSHGSPAHELHLFAIQDAAVPTLCNSCHGNGNSNVDAAGLQNQVLAGLSTIATNTGAALVGRLNDTTKVAPSGYGAWADTGSVTISAKGLTDTTAGCTTASDASCGLASSAAVTINTTTNPAVSAELTGVSYMGATFLVTFTNPVAITFAGGVSNSLSSFSVVLGDLADAGGHTLFASNGNMNKALWNYELIIQDKSNGVHNPGFVSAVLAATADPWGNPNATPPQPAGLWY